MRTLKNILFGTLVGASALTFVGCETMNDSDAAAIGLALLSGMPQSGTETMQQAMNRQLVTGIASNYAAQAGQRQFQQKQMNKIAGGLNNIGQAIQNQGQAGYQQQEQKLEAPKSLAEGVLDRYNTRQNDVFFTCNFHRDFDSDGYADSDEFVNIKDTYKVNEKITAVGVIRKDLNGKKASKELLDSNGRTLKMKQEFISNRPNGIVNYFVFNPNELSPGNYTVVFTADNQYFGRVDFKVVE